MERLSLSIRPSPRSNNPATYWSLLFSSGLKLGLSGFPNYFFFVCHVLFEEKVLLNMHWIMNYITTNVHVVLRFPLS